MNKRLFYVATGIILTKSFLFAAPELQAPQTQVINLLQGYLENSSEVMNASLGLKKTRISQNISEIDSGFDISISSGQIVWKMGDNPSLSLNPGISARMPSLQNLSATATTNLSVKNAEPDINNTNFSVGVDLVSQNKGNRELTKTKNDRTLLKAERELSQKLLSCEKQFYSEIKTLLSAAQSIITSQNDLYSDLLSFEETKIKGYEKTSTTYRLKEMKVTSGEHQVNTKIRSFLHDLKVFYSKCGFSLELPESTDIDYLSYLPLDFPEIKLLDIESLDKEKFTQIEEARWNQIINNIEENNQKDLSLTAKGGFTLGNTTGTGALPSSKSNTLDLGLTAGYKGISATGGVSIPVGSNGAPVITGSLSINPNSFRKSGLQNELTELEKEGLKIAMDKALSSYEIAIADYSQSKKDLLWQEQTITQNLDMYRQLESNLKSHYESGLIKQSEYLSARNNRQRYEIEKKTNEIDCIIYNNNVRSLFYEE